jgi:GT2 family glycosyltransferase
MQIKKTVVAIPAKNEAALIGKCLVALNRQSIPADDIVLLLNDCTDDTARVIATLPPAASNIHVIECSLPPPFAGAGEARRIAMEHAATLACSLAGDGVLLTTDADGQVGEDWIAANLAAIAMGADVVCGQAIVHCIEALMIPQYLHDDNVIEVAYGQLLDEIAAVMDPDPADPWPRHTEESGASIAVTMRAFNKAGGMPKVLSGEDRAFLHSLRRIDAKIRHAPGLKVTVSGRVEGRAEGGMAETIKRRIVQQDEFTDATIEPAADAIRRIQAKQRARRLWRKRNKAAGLMIGDLASDLAGDLAGDLALPADWLDAVLDVEFFGAAWDKIQQASPCLVRRRVAFADVPRETDAAMLLFQQITAATDACAAMHRPRLARHSDAGLIVPDEPALVIAESTGPGL